MKDPKSSRRKYLGYIEMQRMIMRYPSECKDFESRKETEQEKEERLRRNEAKLRCKQRYQLHI